MKVVSDWDNKVGANYSQYQKDSSFHNATWNEWFDKITGTGQEILGSAQGIKDQITGEHPIDQGNLGGGYGTYTATSGYDNNLKPDKNEGKSISPLIWGLIIVAGVGALYFGVSAMGKGKQIKPV